MSYEDEWNKEDYLNEVWKARDNSLAKSPELLDEDGIAITECFCDPCGSPECQCHGKRCAWCLENNN